MSISPTDVWTYVDERLAPLGFDVLSDDKTVEDTIEALEQVAFIRDDACFFIVNILTDEAHDCAVFLDHDKAVEYALSTVSAMFDVDLQDLSDLRQRESDIERCECEGSFSVKFYTFNLDLEVKEIDNV